MQYLKQAIQIVNRTQRQTFIYTYVKEGDTSAKSDLIKYMSEYLCLELWMDRFWGSHFKSSICSLGFLCQRADNAAMFLIHGS